MKKNKIVIITLFSIVILALLAIPTGKIFVNQRNCVGCGDCVQVCPVKAVQIVDGKAVIDVEKCINCEICIRSCTYQAIRKQK